jgi:hypothetical protein
MNTKTASAAAPQGEAKAKEQTPALKVVKEEKKESAATEPAAKRMNLQEKIDSLHKLEALVSKVEYLRECKTKTEKFGSSQNGFQGAKLYLEAQGCEDVQVSNPAIIQELLGICKTRLAELVKDAERELAAFEII